MSALSPSTASEESTVSKLAGYMAEVGVAPKEEARAALAAQLRGNALQRASEDFVDHMRNPHEQHASDVEAAVHHASDSGYGTHTHTHTHTRTHSCEHSAHLANTRCCCCCCCSADTVVDERAAAERRRAADVAVEEMEEDNRVVRPSDLGVGASAAAAAAPRVRRRIVENDAPDEAAVVDSEDEAYGTPNEGAVLDSDEEAADADPNSEGSAMEDNRNDSEIERSAEGQIRLRLLLLLLLLLLTNMFAMCCVCRGV